MEQRTEDEILMRMYLLGEVRDKEQEQTEQRLLTDRQFFEEFLRLEESLIDEYVRGALSKHDQERFEAYFMKAPKRVASVDFDIALRRNLSQEAILNSARATGKEHKWAERRHPVFGFWQARTTAVRASLVCVVLLLVAGAAWLLAERTRLKNQIEQLQSEQGKAIISEEDLKQQINQQRALSDELAQQLNQTQSKLDGKEQEIAKLRQADRSIPTDVKPSVVSMFLAPELGRGEGKSNRVNISNRIDRLRLKLEVDGDGYKKYRAEVQTAEGKGILSSDNLKLKASRRGNVVEVELAAKRITEGDYIIVLSGATGDGDYEKISAYHFRVTKR